MASQRLVLTEANTHANIQISDRKPESYPALSIKALKKATGIKSRHLKQEIPSEDLHIIAGCFDDFNYYLDKLKLSPAQRKDVTRTELSEGCAQSAMREALRQWQTLDPSVTFEALLKIVLSLKRNRVAKKLCEYIVEKEKEDELESQSSLSEGDNVSDESRNESKELLSSSTESLNLYPAKEGEPSRLHTKRELSSANSEKESGQHTSTEPLNLYSAIEREPELTGAKGLFKLAERDLQHETTDIIQEFAVLVTNVAMTMEKEGVTALDFAFFLARIKALDAEITTATQSSLLFGEHFVKQIKKKGATVKDVFEMIDGYYSWFNYLLIEKIIKAFCKHSKDIAERLEEYLNILKQYCKNRLCRIPQRRFNVFRRNHQQVVFKIDREWNNMRLEAVNSITIILAKVLKLQRVALCLRSVSNGCVELVYDIPHKFYVRAIFLTEAQLIALKERGIQCPESILKLEELLESIDIIALQEPNRLLDINIPSKSDAHTLKHRLAELGDHKDEKCAAYNVQNVQKPSVYTKLIALSLGVLALKIGSEYHHLYGSFSEVLIYILILVGLIASDWLILWRDRLATGVGLAFVMMAIYFGNQFLFASAALIHALLVVGAYSIVTVSITFLIGLLLYTILFVMLSGTRVVDSLRCVLVELCYIVCITVVSVLFAGVLLFLDRSIEQLVNTYIYSINRLSLS